MSLLASLPAPRRAVEDENEAIENNKAKGGSTSVVRVDMQTEGMPPPYGQRKGFRPRKQKDFGGGGAFPEIHVAQYPLDMGRPDKKKGRGKEEQTLALTVNAEGDVNYDAIVRGGGNANKWIATGHKALIPKLDKLNAPMEKPGEEEEDETAKATAAALLDRVNKKQAAMNPKNVASVPGEAQYIKYTPASTSASHASGAGARIIKMQDMAVDPLEPPKFSHVKVPRGSGSPPVPVMHSPPRALTAEDRKDWKIPPCVSNWKNAKGYTIPLDKRLAADGRGLQEVQINDGFAKFTEALYIAEQKARAAVEARGKMQKELLSREKERKEAELRELAMQARLDRSHGVASVRDRDEGVPVTQEPSGEITSESEEEKEIPREYRTTEDRRDTEGYESRREREERKRRDEIREERRRERERERRLEAKNAHGYKRSKLTRDKDRDISEKIALGMAKVTGGEAMYDQRLFNQDTGLESGMGADDAYNLYDKALFADRSEIFRGKGKAREGEEADIDTSKFKPTKGFSGAEYGGGDKDSGPVQFEADRAEADPFGLDAFLSDVRKGKDALDGIGKRGSMAASGGGGGGMNPDDYSRSDNRKVNFTSGSNA